MIICDVVPVPAIFAGLSFILQDLFGLYTGNTGIGNAAHLGGAAVGAAYFLMKKNRFRLR